MLVFVKGEKPLYDGGSGSEPRSHWRGRVPFLHSSSPYVIIILRTFPTVAWIWMDNTSFFIFHFFVLSFYFIFFLAPASKLFCVTWVDGLHWHFNFCMVCNRATRRHPQFGSVFWGFSAVPVFRGVPVFRSFLVFRCSWLWYVPLLKGWIALFIG